MERVNISILKRNYSFIFPHKARITERIKLRYKKFMVDSASFDYIYEVNFIETTELNKHLSMPRIKYLEHSNKLLIKGRGFKSEMVLSSRRGKVFMSRNIESFDSFLRVLLSYFLVKQDALLIHSAGIIINNKGYLFPGRTMAGKSTLAARFPKENVLSDELVIVSLSNKRPEYLIHGTPFWGEFAEGTNNKSIALHAILFLRKKKISAITTKQLSLRDALRRFLPRVAVFTDEKDVATKFLDIAINITSNVPTYDFSYNLKVKFDEICKYIQKISKQRRQ